MLKFALRNDHKFPGGGGLVKYRPPWLTSREYCTAELIDVAPSVADGLDMQMAKTSAGVDRHAAH